MTGRARGTLQRLATQRPGRLARGRALLGYIDGRARHERVSDQRLPAYVLQPRHDHKPLL